jgi:hypothetical protein
LSVFPCQFHSICAPLIVKLGKKLLIFIVGLHKKSSGCGAGALHKKKTIQPTNAFYFLGMFINPTCVSAATEPLSGVVLWWRSGDTKWNSEC